MDLKEKVIFISHDECDFENISATIAKAVMQLKASGDMFMVFRERERDTVCIVYKRKDGKFSLIETAGKGP